MGIIYPVLKSLEGVSERVCSAFSTGLHGVQREAYFWSRYPLPIWRRLQAYRHGFLSRAYVYCSLHENDPSEYLSDVMQFKHVRPAVNSNYADVFENKVNFHLATDPYLDGIPTLYGTIESGSFVPFDTDAQDIYSLLGDGEAIVVKPTTGVHGRGVNRVEIDGDQLRINYRDASREELDELIESTDGAIVTEFVEQHPYSSDIWPKSTNSIRILTVKDPSTGELFLPCAVHRFGGSGTGPIDNWTCGGVAAPIDVATGEMIELLSYSRRDGMQRHERHPDTGTKVAGQTIPDWESIKEFVLEVADLHRQNPYIGWDVVLTEDGPVMLEGNCAPGHALFQLHSGLLEDERVEQFFESL